jgi:hypothetical protein
MSKFTQFWKSDISKKGHVATAEERKKDPYLSADSMVYDDDEDSEKSEKNPVVNGKQTTDEMERYARQHGSYRSDDPRFGDVYEE